MSREPSTSPQSIIGCRLSPTQIRQTHLRISQRGFGLPSALLISPCAFVGSWAATLRSLPHHRLQLFPSTAPDILIGTSDGIFDGHVFDALRSLSWTSSKVASEFPSLASLPEKSFKLQKKLSSICLEDELDRLLESSERNSQARLRSAGGPDAGAWLDAIPQSRELSLSNAEFQTAALLRLGADLPILRHIRECNCGVQMEADGYHLLTCPKDGGFIRRHDAWQHCWQQMLRSVNYRVEMEKEKEFEDKKRRYRCIRLRKREEAVVGHYRHPPSLVVVTQSANINGYAAISRDKIKNDKYLDIATSLGYLFKPVAVEVFGRWSPVASSLFHQVARRPSEDFLNDRNSFVNYWRKRLSVCLQQGNARIILRKTNNILPHSPAPISPPPLTHDVRSFRAPVNC